MVIPRDGNTSGQGFSLGFSFLLISLPPTPCPSLCDFNGRAPRCLCALSGEISDASYDSVDKAFRYFFHPKYTHTYTHACILCASHRRDQHQRCTLCRSHEAYNRSHITQSRRETFSCILSRESVWKKCHV